MFSWTQLQNFTLREHGNNRETHIRNDSICKWVEHRKIILGEVHIFGKTIKE